MKSGRTQRTGDPERVTGGLIGGDRMVWRHGPLGLGLGTDSPGKTLSPRGEGEGAGRQEMEGLELLVLGKFPWRERWVVVVGAGWDQFLRPKFKSTGFCFVVASCFSMLRLNSPLMGRPSMAPLCKRILEK